MLDKLVEVQAYQGEGYQPLVDYQSWRVAILRYIDELLPERIDNLECHQETDEVFVLLAGRCLLLIGAPGETAPFDKIEPIDMEPLKLYNIKKGVYHSHTLSLDGTVLIVENQNTTAANSHQIKLTPAHSAQIIALAKQSGY